MVGQTTRDNLNEEAVCSEKSKMAALQNPTETGSAEYLERSANPTCVVIMLRKEKVRERWAQYI
jgi:hypothetical protein